MSPFDYKRKVQESLLKQFEDKVAAITTGNLDLEQYKAATGELRGIKFARDELDRIYKEIYEIKPVGGKAA